MTDEGREQMVMKCMCFSPSCLPASGPHCTANGCRGLGGQQFFQKAHAIALGVGCTEKDLIISAAEMADPQKQQVYKVAYVTALARWPLLCLACLMLHWQRHAR